VGSVIPISLAHSVKYIVLFLYVMYLRNRQPQLRVFPDFRLFNLLYFFVVPQSHFTLTVCIFFMLFPNEIEPRSFVTVSLPYRVPITTVERGRPKVLVETFFAMVMLVIPP